MEEQKELPKKTNTFMKHVDWFLSNWRSGCALVYTVIVFCDFVVFPAWVGLNRVDTLVLIESVKDLDPGVQAQVINMAMREYAPFSLKGAGLVHLSFGAILTGAAMTNRNPI